MNQKTIDKLFPRERRSSPQGAMLEVSAAIALVGALLCLACGGSAYVPQADRVRCYDAADRAAQEHYDTVCGGMPANQCPFTEEVLEALKKRLEECP